MEKHEPKARASRTSRVFFKNFLSAYITQQCSRNKFFYFFYKMYRELRARIDDVGCVHCISTVHSCDVRRVLYGNHGSRISLKILLREIPPITHYINMIFAALILAFT